ncbi:hypothetical protein I2F27_01560 [Acinetobacter sp. B5B]|uniref:hypothetical protein n=1 Tax=Acinetobacter baretiae TaxID=2605383 RepID=UPI0018C2B6CF|nr:hypothetical protein [Acinetobacter baretiae]MBF7682025.1 hypothetical protein [Acinetobacter baretiae]
MDKKTLTRRVNLIRYLGFFVIFSSTFLILLEFKTLGLNRVAIKECGPWLWLSFFYFIISTHYLRYLKEKYKSMSELLGKHIVNSGILSAIFGALMLVTIWIKA